MDEQGDAHDPNRPENFQRGMQELEWGEPTPVQSVPVIHTLVNDDVERVLNAAKPEFVQSIKDDINSRLQLGIDKYGTGLQAFNGRNAAKDAYEECLDFLCYLRQYIFEKRAIDLDLNRETMIDRYEDCIELASLLRELL